LKKPSQCHPLEDFCAGRCSHPPIGRVAHSEIGNEANTRENEKKLVAGTTSVESLAVSVCGILERLIDVDSF
jgi:hypothetical protein